MRRLNRLEKKLAGALPVRRKKKALGKLKLIVADSEGDISEGRGEDEGVHRCGRRVPVRALAAV